MQPVVPKPRLIACPTCGAQTEYRPENPYRSFCSKRCKLIDLGQWASENYRVPDTAPTQPGIDEEQP